MAKQKPNFRGNRINGWAAFRDIGIHSINKGQFPLFLVTVVIIFILWRMPENEIANLVNRLTDPSIILNGPTLIIIAIVLLVWFLHAKSQRRYFAAEMKRLASERNDLQAKLLGDKYKSSSG